MPTTYMDANREAVLANISRLREIAAASPAVRDRATAAADQAEQKLQGILSQEAMETTQLRMAQDRLVGVEPTMARTEVLADVERGRAGLPSGAEAEQDFQGRSERDTVAQSPWVMQMGAAIPLGLAAGAQRTLQASSQIQDDLGVPGYRPTQGLGESARSLETSVSGLSTPARVLSGVAQFAPAMAAPEVGIPALALQMGANKYGSMREAGVDPGAAAVSGTGAALATGAMAVPALMPASRLLGPGTAAAEAAGRPLVAAGRHFAGGMLDAIPQTVAMNTAGAVADTLASQIQEGVGKQVLQQSAAEQVDPQNMARMALEMGLAGGGIGAIRGAYRGVTLPRAELKRLGEARTALENAELAKREFAARTGMNNPPDPAQHAARLAADPTRLGLDPSLELKAAEIPAVLAENESRRTQATRAYIDEQVRLKMAQEQRAQGEAMVDRMAERAEIAETGADIAAEGARMQREQRASAIDKTVQRDLEADRAAEMTAREEGDAVTEASARELEARLEAEAQAQTERGGRNDAAKIELEDMRARLGDMEQSMTARGTVEEHARTVRERVENEILQAKGREDGGQMTVDAAGVARPIDRSVLKANRREIADRVRREVDTFKTQTQREREQVAQVKQAIREKQAAIRAEDTAMRGEARARAQDEAATRKSVPREPAAARAGDVSPAPEMPTKLTLAERMRQIMAARKDGRLSVEEAKAAVARAREVDAAANPPSKEPANALSRPNQPATAASGPAGGSGAGSLPVPEVRAPGAGGGVRPGEPAAAATGPGAPSGQPAGPTRVAGESDAQRRIREAKVEEEKAKLEAEGHRKVGTGIETERAKADADYKTAVARTADAVAKAKAADATVEARQEAEVAADDLARLAEERLSLAKAKLADLDRPEGEASAVPDAQADVAEARAEVAKAKAKQAEVANTVKQSKADVATTKRDAYEQARHEHATRIQPAVEKGVKEALGDDVKVSVEDDGKLSVRDANGDDLFKIDPDLEKRVIAPADIDAWWSSMGERDGVLQWLAKSNLKTEAGRAAKRALDLLDGKRPVDLADVKGRLSPKQLVRLMEESPMGGGYDLKSRGVKIYDAANVTTAGTKGINAVELGREEANHWLTHGLIGSALKGGKAAPHVEALIKATGIDPIKNPYQTVAFLEAVYTKYAEWRRNYDPKVAASAAAVAKLKAGKPMPRLEAALQWIHKTLKAMARALHIAKKPEAGEAGIPLKDVLQEMADGKLTLGARGKVDASGKVDTAFATKRRPLEEGEADPNYSMGRVKPEHRGFVESLREEYLGRGEVTYKAAEKEVDAYVEQHGLLNAERKALAEAKARRERDQTVSDDDINVRVLDRAIERLMTNRDKSGRFEREKVRDLIHARTELLEDTARTLAGAKDRWQTPEQRAASIYTRFWTPSPAMRAEIAKARKAINRYKARNDAAGEARAAKVYDALMERFTANRERALERAREAGLDLEDGASLTKLLDTEAFGVVARNIEDAMILARGGATKAEWILANYRAHLLGDPLTTQSQQLLSNLASAAKGVVYQGLMRPRAVKAAIQSGAIRSAMQNAVDSFKLGKNAWVHQIEGQELGRAENESHVPLTDWYSKLARKVSFDLMAALDGGAQRFNAQLEATALLYEDARARGLSPKDAAAEATERASGKMPPHIAVEAMFRSLPSTFQELALKRPGAEQESLDKIVGSITAVGTWADSRLGEMVPLFKDADTGKGAPIPVSKVVLPFVRTTMAIARAASRNSALLGGVHMMTAARRVGFAKETGEAGNIAWSKEQLRRRIFDAVVVGGVAMHALAALLDAEGTNPSDKEGSYTGIAKGEKTINLFGKRVGYARLEPFATPLAMAANGLRAIREGRNPLMAEAEALLRLGADLAWFRLIADVGQGIQNVKKGGGDVGEGLLEGGKKWAAKTVVAMTPGVGNAGVRNIFKQDDKLDRPAPEGFVDNITAEFGGGPRMAVVDHWGRQVRRGPIEADNAATGFAERVIKGGLGAAPVYDPTAVDTWAKAKGYNIPGWKPSINGKRLTGKDLSDFVAYVGPKFLEEMETLMKAEPDISVEDLKSEVDSIKRYLRDDAADHFAKKVSEAE